MHWNWFDQVLHAFLQQGHTHTLDDSTNFASNPALKKAQLFDLLTVVNESHSKRVPDPSDPSGQRCKSLAVVLLQAVLGWKTFLADFVKPLCGI